MVTPSTEVQHLYYAFDWKTTDQSNLSPPQLTQLFPCSLFPKGSCYMASHASVLFCGLFSSHMILALTTNLFISVVSSSLYPQNPFCKCKLDWQLKSIRLVSNQPTSFQKWQCRRTSSKDSLWNCRSASTGGYTELHCQWGISWRKEWEKLQPLREIKRQKLYRPRIVMGLSMSHMGGNFHYTYSTYKFVANSKCSSMQEDWHQSETNSLFSIII